MFNSREFIYVLAPNAPGDLVASRSVLAALAKKKSLNVIVERSVAPLLIGLSSEFTFYELHKGINVHNPEFQTALHRLQIPIDSHILDLIGTLPVIEWLNSRCGPTSGYDFDKTIKLPYEIIVDWALLRDGAEDRSHFAVRLLRIIPEYSDNTLWPDGFVLPYFGNYLPGSSSRIAMIPGSSKGGINKRMPVDFWRTLATHLRNSGLTLVWFLGPDETDLVDGLVHQDDICSLGMGWSEVISSHASCNYGFSNDTCHVHIRAHIPRCTFVFFRRDDGPEWGSYPSHVDYIEAPITFDIHKSVEEASSWLALKINESLHV